MNPLNSKIFVHTPLPPKLPPPAGFFATLAEVVRLLGRELRAAWTGK